jgi:hypothetical protein
MDAFARVLAEPGSLAARRALAAQWKAANDPRSELVEKQLAYRDLELRDESSSKSARALRDQIRALIDREGRKWAGRIADLVESYEYRRGLVAQVKLRGERFVQHAAELFALAPIQHVDLTAPLAFDQVVGLPQLRKLVSLGINQQLDKFGDREATLLARSPHAAGLRWVGLYRNQIGEAGVEALAASPYLASARYIGLDYNPANPTPTVNDYDGQYLVERPPLAERLARSYGERPWLTGPSTGAWPPDRDELGVTA